VTHFTTPNGNRVQILTRPDTNDEAMAYAILGTDEYRLQGRSFSGWALDIGSHIGTVALALAVDNPDLRVIAVEPVPENATLIALSIAANGLEERVFIEAAAAGKMGDSTTPCMYDFTSATGPGSEPGSMHDTRFVGNVFRGSSNPTGTLIDAPVVSIASLSEKYEVASFRFCKIDCEGCEYNFLAEGAERIEEIVGEWHDGPFVAVQELLSGHHVEYLSGDESGIGLFRAVLS
jgi:FkbM family methyltransferase